MKLSQVNIGGKPFYRVSYGSAQGRQLRKHFAREDAATAFMDQLKEQGMSARWGERERREYEQAVFLLEGTPLVAALTEWREAKRAIRGGSLIEAAVLASREMLPPEPLGIEVAVDRFLAAKTAANLSKRYLGQLKSSLGRLAGSLTAGGAKLVHEATPKQVHDAIYGSDIKARTIEGYLTDARTFYQWCIRAAHCKTNPAASVEMPAVDAGEPGILTVRQTSALLRAGQIHDPGLLPYLALCLFGGLRPEREATLMEWGDIKGGVGLVHARKNRMHMRRHITINATLKAWLAGKGDLPVINRRKRLEAVRRHADTLLGKPLQWPHDCMRHAFATYHLARWKNPANTAFELRHTNQNTLYQHYRALVTVAEARAYWKLTPRRVAKVWAGACSTSAERPAPR
jgi:integrase